MFCTYLFTLFINSVAQKISKLEGPDLPCMACITEVQFSMFLLQLWKI